MATSTAAFEAMVKAPRLQKKKSSAEHAPLKGGLVEIIGDIEALKRAKPGSGGRRVAIVGGDGANGELAKSLRAAGVKRVLSAIDHGEELLIEAIRELRPGDVVLCLGAAAMVVSEWLRQAVKDGGGERPPMWTAKQVKALTGGRWVVPPANGWIGRGFNCYPLRMHAADLAMTTQHRSWRKDRFEDTTGRVAELFRLGAAAVVTDKLPPEDQQIGPLLLVDDTRAALDKFGKAGRARFTGKVICVTGSAGKTTCKELLGLALVAQAPTFTSLRSFNVEYGHPMHMAQTPADAAYGIYEIAVHSSKLMTSASEMMRPHVLLITNVHAKHLNLVKSIPQIAKAKAQLSVAMQPGGVAVLNRDDAHFETAREVISDNGVKNIVTFGAHAKADIRLVSMTLDPEGADVKAEIFGKSLSYRISMPAPHWVQNSLAVLATVHACGADVEAAAARLAEPKVLAGRGKVSDLAIDGGTFRMIDDSTSATPVSMAAAFETLARHQPSPGGRRIAVLGNINSLGKDSAKYHRELAPAGVAAGIERLLTLGDEIEYFSQAMPAGVRVIHTSDIDELYAAVVAEVRAGDVVLIKGSGSVSGSLQVSRIVKRLLTGTPPKTIAVTKKAEPTPAKKKPAKPVAARPLWTPGQLAAATGGTWASLPDNFRGVDDVGYRALQTKPGDLILTTSPEHWGIGYAATTDKTRSLFTLGAAAVITERAPQPAQPERAVLLVENTRAALDKLGRAARARFQGTMICVTGSVGKTATKSALAHVLGRQAQTFESRKSYNRGPGLALGLAQMPPSIAFGVHEFAIGHPRQTAEQAKLMRPNVGIVTEIQPTHLEIYGSSERVAEATAQVFDALEPGGVAVLFHGMMHFERLRDAVRRKPNVARIIVYGEDESCDVRLLGCRYGQNDSRVTASVNGEETGYRVNQPGRHVVLNSLAVLAAVIAVGRDWRKAAADLKIAPLLERRGQRTRVSIPGGSFTLIEDTFNANPESMRAGLDLLGRLNPEPGGRRLAVLAEIEQLGAESARLHGELATAVKAAKIDRVFTIGDEMTAMRGKLPAKRRAAHGATAADIMEAVIAEIRPGDLLLVKGAVKTRAEIEHAAAELKALGDGGGALAGLAEAGAIKRLELTAKDRGSGQSLEILLVGDTDFGESYRVLCEQRGLDHPLPKRGYDSSFVHLHAALIDADLVVANLETPITDLARSPFAGDKTYIHWADVEKAPRHLLRQNIRVVSVANNHTLDYGAGGLAQTFRVLDEHAITCLGGGANASAPLVIDASIGASRCRIAVFAAFDATDGETNGLASLDAKRIANQVRELRAADPNILIIAFPHWGPNYKWRNERQERQASALLDVGVDLIVGHGAHMLQEIERRDERWIVYGLGNLVFNAPGRYRKHGAPPISLIAKLIVAPDGGGLTISLRLYPIVTDNKITDYRTQFTTEDEFAEVGRLLFAKSDDAIGLGRQMRSGRDGAGLFLELPVARNDGLRGLLRLGGTRNTAGGTHGE